MGSEMVRPEAAELDLGRVAESVVARGDLSALTPAERARFYVQMCESLGLNPASQPFAFLRLSGKEVLYATRGATDQLAKIYRVTREIIRGPEVMDLAGTKLVLAVCRASTPDGRSETATATCKLADACGLDNVLMKVETKSKRRATLSILGLGLLDESEVETIRGAERIDPRQVPTLAPPASEPTEDRPEDSSRAVAAFEQALAGADGLGNVFMIWRTALDGLRAERLAPEEWTPTLGALLDSWLSVRGYASLCVADKTAIAAGTMPVDLARWHDELSTLATDAQPLILAAETWLASRWSSLDADASKPYRLALSRWLAAALGTPEDTRGAGVRLGAAVKTLRDQRGAAVNAVATPPVRHIGDDEGGDDSEPPPASPTPRKGRRKATDTTSAPAEDTSWQNSREGMEAHAASLTHPVAVLASAKKHHGLVGYAAVLASRLVALTPPDEHGAMLSESSARAKVNGWMASAQAQARRAA